MATFQEHWIRPGAAVFTVHGPKVALLSPSPNKEHLPKRFLFCCSSPYHSASELAISSCLLVSGDTTRCLFSIVPTSRFELETFRM